MNIHLTEAQRAIIKRAVDGGLYRNEEEAVAAAIDYVAAEQERYDAFNAELKRRVEEGDLISAEEFWAGIDTFFKDRAAARRAAE